MKTLYIECGMGAAGDMLTAALLELLSDEQKQAFLEKMNTLIPGVTVEKEPAVKCGITGTHMVVKVQGEEEESEDVHDHEHHHHDHDEDHEHHHHDHDEDHEHHHHDHGGDHEHHHHDHDKDHEHHHHDHDGDHEHHHHDHDHHGHHHHTSMADIIFLLEKMDVSEAVREHARAVYLQIARAESEVHGTAIESIHFHEVGSMDAVADVVGVCLLMEMVGAQKIVCSPVHVGSGYVRCAHGVLPVPAPATAKILTGIPTYGGKIEGELCTPTGAALLKHFAQAFGDRPLMAGEKIGYGMGKKDFPRANCVRVFLGDMEESQEEIVRLECNLDDMTGEEIGFAMEQLFQEGARDVFTQPIGMKKSRPGIMLTVICMPEDADRLARCMLLHTTTLGVRRSSCERYVMDRSFEKRDTVFGPVQVKHASGMGVEKEKIEYEDLARIAREQGMDLTTLRKKLMQ